MVKRIRNQANLLPYLRDDFDWSHMGKKKGIPLLTDKEYNTILQEIAEHGKRISNIGIIK